MPILALNDLLQVRDLIDGRSSRSTCGPAGWWHRPDPDAKGRQLSPPALREARMTHDQVRGAPVAEGADAVEAARRTARRSVGARDHIDRDPEALPCGAFTVAGDQHLVMARRQKLAEPRDH